MKAGIGNQTHHLSTGSGRPTSLSRSLTPTCDLDLVSVLEEGSGVSPAELQVLGPPPGQLQHRTERLRVLYGGGGGTHTQPPQLDKRPLRY